MKSLGVLGYRFRQIIKCKSYLFKVEHSRSHWPDTHTDVHLLFYIRAAGRVCVCVCICLVHQVAHPSFGEQCLFTYPLIVLLLLCYFLPLLLWFLGHLPWSILHIQHILFFPWLFCIRLKHAFVFHLPLDIGGMFCFRTCLHNWLLLVASLFLPLLYCYIVFLSFFLGTLLFFWVFFLPSCPASVLP